MIEYKEDNLYTLKFVKAGEAGKVLSLGQNLYEDTAIEKAHGEQLYKAYFEREAGKDVFLVVGESMSPKNIHTNNLLLTSSCGTNGLKCGDLIVLKIDAERQHKRFTLWGKMKRADDFGYKLRKFIMVIDLEEAGNVLFARVKERDEETRYLDCEAAFLKKYKGAKEEIAKELYKNVLLSVTYTAKGREYSFHAAKDLYGVVDEVLDRKGWGDYESAWKREAAV